MAVVGVLVFVNQQVADAGLPFFAQVGVFAQQLLGEEQEVVKIHGVEGAQAFDVVRVDLCGELLAVVPDVCGDEFRRDVGVFEEGDVLAYGARFFFVGDFAEFADDVGAVGAVEDAEAASKPEARVVVLEHGQPQAVEGGDGEAACVFVEQGAAAFGHFFGGFVGEGDGEDVVRGIAGFADEPGDFLRDDAGFAAARTGDDQERAAEVGDGFELLRVQVLHGDGRMGAAAYCIAVFRCSRYVR